MKTFVAAGLAVLLSTSAYAQRDQVFGSDSGDLKVETIATGLSNPWALAFLPDGRLLVTFTSALPALGHTGGLAFTTGGEVSSAPLPVLGLGTARPFTDGSGSGVGTEAAAR